jgi:hypothetical protein
MSDRPRSVRRVVGLVAASAAVGVGVVAVLVYGFSSEPAPPPDEAGGFPIPPYAQSRYLNTGPEARHIGSEACATCHDRNHKSYLLTPHSRALSDIDPSLEPPDGSFHHAPSGRSYRVYRQDGQLRHEELLKDDAGKEVVRVDLPVRYLVGSGNFCRTYLVEADGFLHESPVTWYTARKAWDMSPGYDAPQHWGFERPVRAGCLVCHAGRVEPGQADTRVAFHEKAIGCENCHGPGSLHADFHRAKKQLAPGGEDLTIVHPGKLPRDLREAVCAACHLSGPASVQIRGRQPDGFRPGMPLADHTVHYRLEDAGHQMTVVGHVEQLRQSACYQKSPEMTCLNCHDPHAREKPKDPAAFYRGKCLDCHEQHPCSLAPAEREKKAPGDNCATCHMPRSDTDIPHIAFTHHRVGRHGPRPPTPAANRVPDLVAVADESRLSPIDRERNLGLAYAEVAGNSEYARYAPAFRERARERLEAVHAAGLRDGPVAVALAVIYWEAGDVLRAAAFAREAVESKDVPPESRAMALVVLANCERERNDHDGAIALLKEATRLRRFADDWRMIGVNHLDLNRPADALPAFERALAIRPYRHTTHLGLAEAYRRLGDSPRANAHLEKAQWLLQRRQD